MPENVCTVKTDGLNGRIRACTGAAGGGGGFERIYSAMLRGLRMFHSLAARTAGSG